MTRISKFELKCPSLGISEHLLDRSRLTPFLELYHFDPYSGPQIADFQPWKGYPGVLMVIVGCGFAEERERNCVEVGGKPALVVDSETDRLTVITHHDTHTGKVKVTVDGTTATSLRDFDVLSWPKPGSFEDGPPFSYAGTGAATEPSAGDIPSTGTARILVVCCNPTDLVPPAPATIRQDVIDTFADVTTFYDQASYGVLDVQVDVTDFVALLDNSAHYHRANGARGYPNIDSAAIAQLSAECAQGAVDQGYDLDDYEVFVVSVYLPGLQVRAWGGWSESNFAYNDGAGTSINQTTTNPLAMIIQGHNADWGRAAHEFGHGLVDAGLVLGEDVYGSDLIDPSEATAAAFDIMGNCDSHPLFSGFYMHQLGWYDAANIRDLEWDRNPFSQELDVIAHGLTEDTQPNRYHLIRIKISDGLYYFVEVRQRPDPTAATPQVFDENLPLSLAGTPDGGVVVTKVITGEMNNNHQTRLITLLHDTERVLVTGQEVVDPLRTIRISVVDDGVQDRPRVCRVRVEWAQEIADTPGGDFDLRIEPWGPGWETVDIWVDRSPFGTFDSTDAAGNPTGNGDEPRSLEINRFEARIRNDGTADAHNVRITHYAITPPGVGDNGSWSPIATNTLGTVPSNGSSVSRCDWVPLVGEHTCLKVAISQQLGEITGGNNSAQENVFNFQPPASSVPEPVVMTLAVRNPVEERVMVYLSLVGVPYGFYVYFPHRWVWLEPLGERKLDLIVVPIIDFIRMEHRTAPVRINGYIPHVYSKRLEITGVPASWMSPIGGILANVTPKHKGAIRLYEKLQQEKEDHVKILGKVEPNIKDQKLRVDMTHPNGEVSTVNAWTDQTGGFAAYFHLRQRKNIQEKEIYSSKATKGQCMYAFQAHIINAIQIAPVDSNIVWYEIRDGSLDNYQPKKTPRKTPKKRLKKES